MSGHNTPIADENARVGDKEENKGDIAHIEQNVPSLPSKNMCFEGYTEEETKKMTKRLVAKFDLRVLPVLILLFIFNILDRSNSCNLTGVQFNNLIVFAFLGYVLFQIPGGFVLANISPAIYLSIAVVLWGAVSLACGFAHSYAVMSVLRVLVGATESPFFPGALLILSSFYTRKELAPRIALMYSGNSLANGFGGILAAGIIAGMEGKAGIAGWRWLFILEGAITSFLGISCYFLLPSLPSKTTWLSDEERRLSIWRMTIDTAGSNEEEDNLNISKKEAAILVLKDWKILLLILQQLFISHSQSFTYFFPSIVASLGYNTNQTLLLTAPPYFFAFFSSIAVAVSSSHYHETGYHIAIPMITCAIGNILAITLPLTSIGARYFSMFLLCAGSFCAFNLSFAWVASSVPRPRMKRSVALSLVNALAAVSHFWTPYMFPSADGPRYLAGGAALSVFCVGVSVIAMVIKFALRQQNRKLEMLDREGKEYTGSLANIPRGYRFNN
ncbi:Allantoate permease [Pseudohyphozyma bogoriensis]|nr:Allantoate permease [Pseudohyphozyma bogoriensis]